MFFHSVLEILDLIANFQRRAGYIKETTHGTNFHDNTAEVESDEE